MPTHIKYCNRLCMPGHNNYLFVGLQVIDETLSPTWDELLVFDEILVYGRREDIKANPPVVIIEIYDQDKVNSQQRVSVTFGEGFFTCFSRFPLPDGKTLYCKRASKLSENM